jgi:class III poly(R)-hydroxyalkanoic acid synthase PhaE subunit
MDIGADFFLQMMKAIYPAYSEAFSEKNREWFQKACQNFFAELSPETKGGNVETFFQPWMEKIQKEFAKGKPPIDFEIQNKILQSIIQNGNLYVRFMNTVLEATKAAYAGEGSDETLNEIYNKVTQHYLELYQESVGKYLEVPQLGIQREAHHQIMAAIDAYHGFMGAVGDFSVRFSMPLKNALDILQQAIKDRQGPDDDFRSAKEVYNFAVNILEKAYDEYLKSPEGVQNVADLVEKYLEYKKKLNTAKDIWFRSLSIPTRREMEDVYRGIYDLRKKTRKQDAIIREQNDTIKALNRKLKKIEESLPGALSNKRTSVSSATRRRVKSTTSTGVPQKAKTSRKDG